jgi:hypothetical protein
VISTIVGDQRRAREAFRPERIRERFVTRLLLRRKTGGIFDTLLQCSITALSLLGALAFAGLNQQSLMSAHMTCGVDHSRGLDSTASHRTNRVVLPPHPA